MIFFKNYGMISGFKERDFMKWQINKYAFNTKKDLGEIKIFHFSDVHFRENFPIGKLREIVKQANIYNPDYICISGDLIHDARRPGDLKILKEFLVLLSSTAPIIMSLGNHDLLTMGKNKKWTYYVNYDYFNMLSGIPQFHLLDNDNWKDQKVQFTGITMPSDYYEGKNESIAYLSHCCSCLPEKLDDKDTKLYQVVSFHSPISLLECEQKEYLACLDQVNLVLSGHMHGGLTPPILEPFCGKRGLIGPTNLKLRTFFPNYVRGHIEMQRFDAVICTGISKLNIPTTDVLFPPNINEVTVDGKKVLQKEKRQ